LTPGKELPFGHERRIEGEYNGKGHIAGDLEKEKF
jgi:hypothetical protein